MFAKGFAKKMNLLVGNRGLVHQSVLVGVSGLAVVALMGLTMRLGILTNPDNQRVDLAEAARWSRLVGVYFEEAVTR
jgi:hypothetical protein